MITKTRKLTRQQLGEFLPNPRAVRAFEGLQDDTTDMGDALTNGAFVVLVASSATGSARVLTPADSIALNDEGAGERLLIGLTDTGVVADTYGSASKVVAITVNAKGRVTALAEYDLDSDNVSEGAANLFFTDLRARKAVSEGTGNISGVFAPTVTGIANITAATASGQAKWTRQGNVVHVSGTISVQPTVITTPTSVAISLPIASAIAGVTDIAGIAACLDAQQSAAVEGDAANDRALLRFISTGIAASTMSYMFSYPVLT